MTDEVRSRATAALVRFNRGERPLSPNVVFSKVFIVGPHIWFVKHAADEWLTQVNTPYALEEFTYVEAYELAKIDKKLKFLIKK